MKLTNLLWVLGLAGLAGTIAACNTGLPTDGCGIGRWVNPDTGLCELRTDMGGGGMGGTGMGGTGGSGMGGSGGAPVAGTKVISGACNNTFSPANFQLPVTLSVTPDGPVEAGGSFDATVVGGITLSESFIAGVLDSLPALTMVDVVSGGVMITVVSGADGDDAFSPFRMETIGILDDPDNNGIPGPIPIVADPVTVTYDVTGDAGTSIMYDFIGLATATEIGTGAGQSQTGAETLILGAIGVGLPCESGVYTDDGGEPVLPVIPTSDEDLLQVPIE